jgi:hypothetical protein
MFKVFRSDLTTPKLSATDTTFVSGSFGVKSTSTYNKTIPMHWYIAIKLIVPTSPALSAQAILEVDVEGSGELEDPYGTAMSKNMVEITTLTGLPDFLYLEARRYAILKAKGFTDEEMKLLLGYVPQYQVDLDAVTWGAFEFHPDKASTVIITIIGDNPYKLGAVERQKARAKRVFRVPKSYSEVVSLYNMLKKDYPHWLAGVHNFAYQVLGYEFFDWLQNVDFYYGELVEHKTHYDQLKRVPEQEIRRRLYELEEKIKTMTVLTEERDKHLAKIREILAVGW